MNRKQTEEEIKTRTEYKKLEISDRQRVFDLKSFLEKLESIHEKLSSVAGDIYLEKERLKTKPGTLYHQDFRTGRAYYRP